MYNLVCSAGKVGQISYLLLKTKPPYVETSICYFDKRVNIIHADMLLAKRWTDDQIDQLTLREE